MAKKYYDSPIKKFLGLMFKRRTNTTHIFRFKKQVKHSIHTFFVFFPIDIKFLDKNNKVVEIKKNLKPFRIYFPKNYYFSFIETPSKETNIKKEDKINL